MKTPTNLLLIILLSSLILSCKPTKNNLQTSKESVSKTAANTALYYELIHEAELALIRDKYTTAVDFYLAAKEENNFFIKDAENALLVAVEAENYTAAAIFARNLLQKDVPKSYFEKRKAFQAFIETEEWKVLSVEKKTAKKDIILKERLAELLALDQKYRYDAFYSDSLVLLDAIIKRELLEVFKEKGYPNASVMGVSMQNDTTIGRNDFEVLFLPQVVQDRSLWVPILEGFLEAGQLSNHFFEAHGELLYPSGTFELTCLGSVQNLFIQVKDELYTCCCEAEGKIDAARKKFYLEPLKEVRLKAEFYYERDRRFGFGGRAFKYTLRKGEQVATIKEELGMQGFILHKKLDSEAAYFK